MTDRTEFEYGYDCSVSGDAAPLTRAMLIEARAKMEAPPQQPLEVISPQEYAARYSAPTTTCDPSDCMETECACDEYTPPDTTPDAVREALVVVERAVRTAHAVTGVMLDSERDALATLTAALSDLERLATALGRIEQGCMFPEDDVQRAIRDTARTALGRSEK